VSYGAGLTNMSLKAFVLATFLGMIPPTFAFTYLGNAVCVIAIDSISSSVGRRLPDFAKMDYETSVFLVGGEAIRKASGGDEFN
jgi:hypothetical protein